MNKAIERYRSGRNNNIEFYIKKKIDRKCADWLDFVLDKNKTRAVMNTVMNLWVP